MKRVMALALAMPALLFGPVLGHADDTVRASSGHSVQSVVLNPGQRSGTAQFVVEQASGAMFVIASLRPIDAEITITPSAGPQIKVKAANAGSLNVTFDRIPGAARTAPLPGTGAGENLIIHFTNGAPQGTYFAKVTDRDAAPNTSRIFAITLIVDSECSFAVAPLVAQPIPGDRVPLVAIALDRETPLLGASVLAAVSRDGVGIGLVSMTDDGRGADHRAGDGAYTAEVVTDLPGAYRVYAILSGTRNPGGAVSRWAAIDFPVRSAISGFAYRSPNPFDTLDTNGDGQVDSVRFVMAAIPDGIDGATYRARITLSGTDREGRSTTIVGEAKKALRRNRLDVIEVTFSVEQLESVGGTDPVEIVFPPVAPVLSEVLYSAGYVAVATAPPPATTPRLPREILQAPAIELLDVAQRSFVASGPRLLVPLRARVNIAGSYRWSARLVDEATMSDVDAAQGVWTVARGDQILNLDFNLCRLVAGQALGATLSIDGIRIAPRVGTPAGALDIGFKGSILVTTSGAPVPECNCPGDCDGNGRVSLAEVSVASGINRGSTPLDHCRAADTDADGHVDTAEVQRSLQQSLSMNCPNAPDPCAVMSRAKLKIRGGTRLTLSGTFPSGAETILADVMNGVSFAVMDPYAKGFGQSFDAMNGSFTSSGWNLKDTFDLDRDSILKVRVKHRKLSGEIDFTIKGKDGAYMLSTAGGPTDVVAELHLRKDGDPSGGTCAVMKWSHEQCELSKSGTTLYCASSD